MIEDYNDKQVELEPFDALETDEQEYIETIYDELIQLDCEHCIKNLLAEVYSQAFRDGQNCVLLAVSDSLRGMAENNI